MPGSQVTLFTSIPPRLKRIADGRDYGHAWQTMCIDSWETAGFRVISLNAPNEIDLVQRIAPSITIWPISEDRRPRISDFFAAAKKSESEIVGIVNGDCMLLSHADLPRWLSENTRGLVVCERLNISPRTLRSTGLSNSGFDGFFFPKSSLSQIDWDAHWQIGAVWIDYWLPLSFHVAALEIQTLPFPALLHLDHDIAWDWGLWKTEVTRILDLLRKASDEKRLDNSLRKQLFGDVPVRDPGDVQQILYKWILSQRPLWIPEPESADELTMKLVNASARFNQPFWYYLSARLRVANFRIRDRLRQLIDTLGLRSALYSIGLVKRRTY